MRFGMQVAIQAHSGKGSELATIMLEAAKAVERAQGCQLYVVQVALADEDKILVTEIWESEEAHKASLAISEVLEVISKARPLIHGMEHHPARPLGGVGIAD